MKNPNWFSNIIEQSSRAMYTCDAAGQIKFYNRAAVHIWGREPEIKDLWNGAWKMYDKNGERIPTDKCPMAIAIKEARPVYEEEIMIRRPDGSVRYVNQFPSPMYDADGNLTGGVNMLTDVTEKKEKEKHSEEKYGSIIEQASDAILIHSFDGTIHEFNHSCYTMLGYTRDEYTKLKLDDILIEDIIISKEKFAAIKAGNAKTVFRHLKRKDGSLLEVEVFVKQLADGKVISFARDITERKKAAQELSESRAFNQSILSSVNAHIAVVEQDGNIISTNRAWNNFSIKNGENILSRTGIGTNYIDACRRSIASGESTAIQALDGFKKVISKELPFFEMEYPCHSAEEQHWFLLRITNFADDSMKVVMMHIDITDQVKARMKLDEALAKYDSLSKATSDTIWDWDITENRIQYNSGITKIFGYESAEVSDVTDWWKQNIHPDDRLRVSRSLDKVFVKRRTNFQLTYRFRCTDGSYKYIFDRAMVIFDAAGKAIRMIGAMQDVTYQMEEEIRITKATINAQENERHQIGLELHDNVNQLLTASLINLGMMKKSSPEKSEELVNNAKLYVKNAIEELRKISHRLAPISVNKVSIKESFDRLIHSMNASNQFIIKKQFDDFWETGISNEIQLNLYRILQEQLTNIVKYSTATCIEISVTHEQDFITLRVADNGKGFDTKHTKKGIGLNNIEKRCKLLSGNFTLNTAPGKGCELIVSIPLDNKSNML